jgi:protein-tyrosine phosphatase
VTTLRRRNFRELGGLPTRSPGVFVRHGYFYRSSSLARFDAEALRVLTSLGLRRAVDLRTSAEVAQSVTAVLPAPMQPLHVPLFELARQNWIGPPDQSPKSTASRYIEMLEDGLGALAAVVVEAARPNSTPFVIACSAGRDRTGIVVACLLDLLDVTDQAIAGDYALSDEFDPESGRAHGATMHELLILVRRRYVSTQQMLASHGVTSNVVGDLRRELLVQPERAKSVVGASSDA